LAFLNKS